MSSSISDDDSEVRDGRDLSMIHSLILVTRRDFFKIV